jgi:hypothetical protein
MPVFPSSYENAKKIVLDDPNLPSPYVLNLPNASSFFSAIAFADFFQEGAYSVVATMLDFGAPATGPPTVFFLRKNASGDWIDATSLLLADQTGCFNTKALVADFNGDGKPDVFFACTGYDFLPFPGEKQRILLSQPDGTYSNVELPFARTYSNGGSAGDLNGDGKPDVVLTASGTGSITGPINPFVLLNNGDGTFTQVFDRLPDVLPAFNLELIDTAGNGYYDLFVADGPRDGSTILPNGVLLNDGAGYFRGTPIIKFPNPPGPNGATMSVAMDFAYVDGWLYMAQIDNHFQYFTVRKLRLSDLTITTPYQHQDRYTDGPTNQPWLYPRASDRKIVPQGANAIYPIDPGSSFGWSIDY